MDALLDYIDELNANRVFKLQNTATYWRHKGVETIEQFARHAIEVAFTDAWIGCYGVRHNGSIDHFTDSELISMTDELNEQRLFDEEL
jgi:hypothetical protein